MLLTIIRASQAVHNTTIVYFKHRFLGKSTVSEEIALLCNIRTGTHVRHKTKTGGKLIILRDIVDMSCRPNIFLENCMKIS